MTQATENRSLRIDIGGETRTTTAVTVLDLVQEVTETPLDPSGRPLDGTRLGIAVARNGAVVPRGLWAGTEVGDGDAFEIVGAEQGG